MGLMNDERGVVVYYVRAIVAFIVFGVTWYVGNIIIFAEDIGIASILQGLMPGYFFEMDSAIKLFWGTVLPILFMVSIALYVLMASQIKEPTSY